MAVENRTVVLKASLVAVLPALWVGVGSLLYERTPDVAAGLEYEVVTNRLTGHSCLEFPGAAAPEGLKDLAC